MTPFVSVPFPSLSKKR